MIERLNAGRRRLREEREKRRALNADTDGGVSRGRALSAALGWPHMYRSADFTSKWITSEADDPFAIGSVVTGWDLLKGHERHLVDHRCDRIKPYKEV